MKNKKVFDVIDRYTYLIKHKSADEIIKNAKFLNLGSKVINYIQLTLLDDQRVKSNSEDAFIIKGCSSTKINDIVEIFDEASLYDKDINRIDINKICFNVLESVDMNEIYKDFEKLKNSSIVIFLSNILKVDLKNNKKRIIDNLNVFIRELCLIKDEYTRLYFVTNLNDQNMIEDILIENLSEYFRVNIFSIL